MPTKQNSFGWKESEKDWEAGDAVQNIFRAETEMTTLTDSGLKAGLLV